MMGALKQLEGQIGDLKKSEMELRSQNQKLNQILKNLGRKLIVRLPISLESLEKSLTYDLIFPDEIESWKRVATNGLVVDVRPAHEYARGAISGSMNIPFDQLVMKLETLTKDQPLLVVCENGIKSVSACEILNTKGYPFTYVLKGGMSMLRSEESARAAAAAESSSAKEAVASL